MTFGVMSHSQKHTNNADETLVCAYTFAYIKHLPHMVLHGYRDATIESLGFTLWSSPSNLNQMLHICTAIEQTLALCILSLCRDNQLD